MFYLYPCVDCFPFVSIPFSLSSYIQYNSTNTYIILTCCVNMTIGNGALPSDACWKIFARFSLIPPKPFNSEFTYQKPAAITEIPDWWGLSSEEKALFEEREAHNAAQAQANEKTPPEFDS